MIVTVQLTGNAQLELGPDVLENLKRQALEDLRNRVSGSVAAVYGPTTQAEVMAMLQDELYRIVRQEVGKYVEGLDIEGLMKQVLEHAPR